MGRLDAGVLVYHSHEARGFRVIGLRGCARSRARVGGASCSSAAFPHGQVSTSCSSPAGAPWPEQAARGAAPADADAPARTRSPWPSCAGTWPRSRRPSALIHLPQEGQEVAPGFWAHGWALDDSGIAEIRVAASSGPRAVAAPGGGWPGLEKRLPGLSGRGLAGSAYRLFDPRAASRTAHAEDDARRQGRRRDGSRAPDRRRQARFSHTDRSW